MKSKTLATTAVFVVLSQTVLANSALEETMFRSGKIYTFVLVAFLVFAVLVGYLIRLDRKLSKLERELENQSKS
ncbi:MAG TPA: CcmD family protein [Luteibaculaceae bacterium]|nr:CcmD family protein [Luteibaculaceae bacterium]